MPADNVHSIETQRAIAALAGPLSKHVGMAAAIEAAKNFLQVEMSSRESGERFDTVAVARDIIQARAAAPAAYGASWKDADVTTLATLLAFTWVDACSKDGAGTPDDEAVLADGRPPEADF